MSASERLCRNHSGSRPANPTPERPPQTPTPPEVESDEDAQLPATGHLGDIPGQGCWRTTKNGLRCVWHLTRGFTPFRTDSVPWLEGGRGGVVCKTAATGLVRTACQGVGLKPPRTLKRIETKKRMLCRSSGRLKPPRTLKRIETGVPRPYVPTNPCLKPPRTLKRIETFTAPLS